MATSHSILNAGKGNICTSVEQPDGKLVAAAIVSNLGSFNIDRGVRLSRKISDDAYAPLDPEFGKKGLVETTIYDFNPISIEKLSTTEQTIKLTVKDSNNNRAKICYLNNGALNIDFGNNGIKIVSPDNKILH